MIVLDLLIGVQGRHNHPQQVIRVPEESLHLYHSRDVYDRGLKGEQGLAVLLSHLDEHEDLDRQPNLIAVHDGAVATDDPGPLQFPYPALAWGEREADSGGQLGQADSALALQHDEDLTVQAIHPQDSSTAGVDRGRSWEQILSTSIYRPSMALDTMLGFAVLAALLVAAPGPDWAFTLSVVARGQSLAAAVAGLVSGYLVMTLAVATGVGLLVARSPTLLTALTALGASYLIWLGWRSLRTPEAPHRLDGTDTAAVPASRRSTLLVGIGVSGLNPKALLIFMALLPQFAQPAADWPLSLQLAVLGLIFTALVGAFYPVLGTVARTFATRSTRTALLLTRGAGAIMIALGVILLWERWHR